MLKGLLDHDSNRDGGLAAVSGPCPIPAKTGFISHMQGYRTVQCGEREWTDNALISVCSTLWGYLRQFSDCCSALQVINFARVPLRHQLVVMNGSTILDSAFLCW